MKPALTRLPLAALLAASSLVACSDDSNSGQELNCEIRVSPGALALGTLCLDASSEKTFEIENIGQAECLVGLSLAGLTPQHFAISAEQVTIPVGVKQPITVTYHPASEGGALAGEQHFARVMITSNAEENGTFELSVDGETGSTETKGILSLSCADTMKRCSGTTEDGEACCRVISLEGPTTNGPPYYGRNYLSEVKFGDVQNGQSVTVPLKVTNLGCGQLDVSSLVFTPTTAAGFCDPSSVSVLTPMPVSVSGSVSAQDRKSANIELKFNPTEANCSYFASVKVESNDPDIVDGQSTATYGKFNLVGAGTEGLLVSYPANVAFGDIATGTTVEQVIKVSNNGRRAAEVSSVALRSGAGVFQITKLERPNCDGTTSEIPFGTSFQLKESDPSSPDCGDDQVNVTVTFTPDDAGVFQNHLEVNYGDGILSVQLSGRSEPELVVDPGAEIRFYGPRSLGCDTCTTDDLPNASCDGACASDADCDSGPCVGGICAENDEGSCTETCGASERVIRLCNNGHAPLKFDDAAQGGGLVVTGADGGTPPMHVPASGINDPARDGKPLFSITTNGCADTSGNGITLPPGQCCEATVHYLDTRNGGSPEGQGFHRAELHVYTNDPGYPRDGANGGGLGLDLMARSDYDFDPIAKFTAYDFEKGPGQFNGPRQGKMAVLDASESADPTCDWSQPTCDKTKVNPITSYKWRVVAVSGAGEYPGAMVGEIDLADPNKNCPSWINNGKCFEVPDLGPATGRVIRFYPDIEAPRNYRIELTVTDSVCSPPHQGVALNDIQVSGG